jgi:hypothetical protein
LSDEQPTQVLPLPQTGVWPTHAVSDWAVHSTHTLFEHTGVLPLQSLELMQSMHTWFEHTSPLLQSPSPLQATQVLFGPHTGVAPVHAVAWAVVHSTQALALQIGVLPLQLPLPVHCTLWQEPWFAPAAVMHTAVPGHSEFWVQATQVLFAEHTGVLPPQAESSAHSTHWLPGPQTGSAFGQSTSWLHSTQSPLPPQTVLPGHSLSLAQARHVLLVPHTGVLPVHAEASAELHSTQALVALSHTSPTLELAQSAAPKHPTQVCVMVLHTSDPLQSIELTHSTHWLVVVSHTSLAEQRVVLLAVHSTHWLLALHAGALVGHLLASVEVHATHVPWETLHTVLPAHAAFDWHPVHTFNAVLHMGMAVPAHCALLVHCTHVLVAVSQTLPVHRLESAAVQITHVPLASQAGVPIGQLLVSAVVQSTQAPLVPHTLPLGHSVSLLQPRHWLLDPHTGLFPVHSAFEPEVHSTQVLLDEQTGSLSEQLLRSAVVHSTQAPELAHARFIGQLEPPHPSQ